MAQCVEHSQNCSHKRCLESTGVINVEISQTMNKATQLCSNRLENGPFISSCSSSTSVSFSEAFDNPPPMDGGHGWFVVLGAFMIFLICDGISFSFGVVFIYLVEEFEKSKSETAWIGSIFYAMSLGLGPLASFLTIRFGCRKVTIFAGFLSCFGLMASSFVSSLWHLYITFGIVVGSSFSFCYVSCVVIVAYYFEKRRSLATGLAVCGTGIGTFTFAPLCDFLIIRYNWRSCFLILGAISLNICAAGALFCPLTFTEEQRRQRHLLAFGRLTRPVSCFGIPSHNRNFPHSSNSEIGSSATSDSDEQFMSMARSQIIMPTFADNNLGQMCLSKLPELFRCQTDPQLAIQRFLRSRDVVKSVSMIVPNRNNVHIDINRHNSLSLSDDCECNEDVKIHASLPSENTIDEGHRAVSNILGTNGSNICKSNSCIVRHNHIDDQKMYLTEQDTLSKKKPTAHRGQIVSSFIDECVSNEKFTNLKHSNKKGKQLDFKHLLDERVVENHKCPSKSVAVKASANDKGVTFLKHSAIDDKVGGSSIMLMNKHSTYLILYRNDIFFRGSRVPLPATCATSCPELSRLRLSDSESDDDNCLIDHCPCLQPMVESVEDTFDRQILTHPLFLLLGFSNFLLYFWADIPYIFAADFAISLGISESKATFLISVIGIVNTFGQVCYVYVPKFDCFVSSNSM